MALLKLTNLSSGAPALSGTNGTLCAVLDWALPQAGWAIEYTNGANARVYRPGSGNRYRLHVNHDSAVSGYAYLATIRGCENATDALTLVNPFPTVAQVANNFSTVLVSNGANSTAREYMILVSPTYVFVAISTMGSNNAGWDYFFFGDVAPAHAEDTFNTCIIVGVASSTSVPNRASFYMTVSAYLAGSGVFWVRSIDGSILSSRGALSGRVSGSTNTPCNLINTPPMRGGYLNQITRERMGLSDGWSTGTTTGANALVVRGWLPQVWSPLHCGIGGVTTDDTFTDSAYNPGSQFRVIAGSTTAAIIVETTDTWSPPSG